MRNIFRIKDNMYPIEWEEVVVMSKLIINGNVYHAVMDENGEAVQLSRYEEIYRTSVTLCFDNTSDGSTSDEVLRYLKNQYLKHFTNHYSI